MILLSNGCSCSRPSVYPKNWKTKTAKANCKWYIHYRFYDPGFRHSDGPNVGKIKPKLVVIKGMNDFDDLIEKQAATQALYNDEMRMLKECDYNPITGYYKSEEPEANSYISSSMPLDSSLQYALDQLNCEPHTKEDIRSTLKYFLLSASALNIDKLAVGIINEGHIKMTLNNCANLMVTTKTGVKKKKQWSNNQYNHYRKYISILFKELKEFQAVSYNPAKELSKQKTLKKLRETLSIEDRRKIDALLRTKHYEYWRFMHIFFHSGARETELASITPKDVDLQNQRFKVIVKKGREQIEKWKVIKNIALPLWIDTMKDCNPADFVFALGFKPGKTKLRTQLISTYWRKLVKKPLGITADFYSLKHSNSTEIVTLLDEQAAAAMNSHTSTAMVVNIYDTQQENRQAERLRNAPNAFC
jgi:integrase